MYHLAFVPTNVNYYVCICLTHMTRAARILGTSTVSTVFEYGYVIIFTPNIPDWRGLLKRWRQNTCVQRCSFQYALFIPGAVNCCIESTKTTIFPPFFPTMP